MFRKGITSLSGLEMGAVKPHSGSEYTVFLEWVPSRMILSFSSIYAN